MADSLEERARKFLEHDWWIDDPGNSVVKDCVAFARIELEAAAKLVDSFRGYDGLHHHMIAAAIRAYAKGGE